MQEYRGEVFRLFYSSESFSAGVLMLDDGEEIKFAGKVFAKVGDRVDIRGEWEDSKFGRQVKVESFSFDMDLDEGGLVDFLAKSASFRGVGKARAQAIAAATRGRFEEAIQDPAVLARIANIPIEVAENLATEWNARAGTNRVMAGLAAYGVTPARAAKLYRAYGDGILTTVRENPYYLIGRVTGFGFKIVDQIALKTGIPRDKPERIRAGVEHVVREAHQDGHTWVEVNDLYHAAGDLLQFDDLEERQEKVPSEMSAMIREGGLVKAKVDGACAIFLPRMYEAECYVSARLLEMGSSPDSNFPDLVRESARAFEPMLTDEQADAVVNALSWRASVMSGKAGTGKTFTVCTIREVLVGRGLDVELCAPTGKAAKRLEQSTGCEARTIHRLLGAEMVSDQKGSKRFRFKRDEDDPLLCDAVIVDEVSMVDVELMQALLRAIRPGTSLILVGDHNQLPSVGPGSILRDLFNAEVTKEGTRIVPACVLSHVHRNAGELRENIAAVLDGKLVVGDKPRPDETLLRPWFTIRGLEDPHRLASAVEGMIEHRLPAMEIEVPEAETTRPIDPWTDVQILTPMHKGPIGTIELNKRIQALRQRELGRDVPPLRTSTSRARPLIDDRVIQTRNDYELDVMNGTHGIVQEKLTEGAYLIQFEGKGEPVEVPGSKMSNVELAYALTVHKVQGSEFPVVVLVAHKAHSIMHHRGLFYTGVSRARKSCIIVGEPFGMRNCVQTVRVNARRTLFSLLGDDPERARDMRDQMLATPAAAAAE